MSFLSFLFPSAHAPSNQDHWTQPQREALVDLLYYSIYADNHLSLLEEHRIGKELESVDWKGKESLDAYIRRAIARARDARNDAGIKESHLASIKARLETESARSKAAALCEEVLRADGIADRERDFLKEVRAALGL